MLSTREQLEKRTGPYGVGRLSFLQSLVTEFQDTTSDGKFFFYFSINPNPECIKKKIKGNEYVTNTLSHSKTILN